ncbi:MAG: hypothetical protein EBZ77_13460 [Chitinophagia bacterium]|nr:hypothetical protein [Chitinophagia bacterium]
MYAQPRQKSATEEVFSKVESVGQFAAGAGAGIATIVAVAGIIGGWMVIRQSDAQVESTAKAKAPSRCSQERVTTSTRGGTRTRFETKCTTDVVYTADGATRQASVETPTRYSEGDTLSVYYVPGSNESQVSATRTPRLAGYIIIGFSVFVFLASWIWYAATKKWEGAAALGGFSSIAGVFRH